MTISDIIISSMLFASSAGVSSVTKGNNDSILSNANSYICFEIFIILPPTFYVIQSSFYRIGTIIQPGYISQTFYRKDNVTFWKLQEKK